MKKILLITEFLTPPFDEGIKKTVYNMYNDLKINCDLKVICREGFEQHNVETIKVNALFFSLKVFSTIRAFKPQTIIYFPFASSTFASYLRLRILSIFAFPSNSVFLALQPKPLKNWQKILVKNFLKPNFSLTPSPELFNIWSLLSIKSALLPLWTDLEKFCPIKAESQKNILREKYNLPKNKFIISHMGHLNYGRNLQSLIQLQKDDIQIVVVCSTSTPKDAIGPDEIKTDLLKNGVIIIDSFIENIAEVYQLSDLYIFPVVAKNSSIGMPLSILEARACGVKVLTTDFGSIRSFLNDDNNNIYYSIPSNFVSEVETIRKSNSNPLQTNVNKLNDEFRKTLFDSLDLNQITNTLIN